MNAIDRRPPVFPRPFARYELDRGGGVTGCNNNNRCLRPTSICQIRFSENGKRKKKGIFSIDGRRGFISLFGASLAENK